MARKSTSRAEIIRVILPIAGLIGTLIVARIYQPLDQDYFYIAEIILFFIPLAIQAYLTRGGRPYTGGRVLPTWLFLGPLLIAAMLLVNGALDSSVPDQKVVTINRKIHASGRGGTHYRLEFASWRKPGFEKVNVSSSTYNWVQPGDAVALNVHRGALGFVWIGGVQPLDRQNR
jgi:hypothetical protein